MTKSFIQLHSGQKLSNTNGMLISCTISVDMVVCRKYFSDNGIDCKFYFVLARFFTNKPNFYKQAIRKYAESKLSRQIVHGEMSSTLFFRRNIIPEAQSVARRLPLCPDRPTWLLRSKFAQPAIPSKTINCVLKNLDVCIYQIIEHFT